MGGFGFYGILQKCNTNNIAVPLSIFMNHGSINRLDGTFICWLTVVYAFHVLEQRREVWNDIQNLKIYMMRTLVCFR